MTEMDQHDGDSQSRESGSAPGGSSDAGLPGAPSVGQPATSGYPAYPGMPGQPGPAFSPPVSCTVAGLAAAGAATRRRPDAGCRPIAMPAGPA